MQKRYLNFTLRLRQNCCNNLFYLETIVYDQMHKQCIHSRNHILLHIIMHFSFVGCICSENRCTKGIPQTIQHNTKKRQFHWACSVKFPPATVCCLETLKIIQISKDSFHRTVWENRKHTLIHLYICLPPDHFHTDCILYGLCFIPCR